MATTYDLKIRCTDEPEDWEAEVTLGGMLSRPTEAGVEKAEKAAVDAFLVWFPEATGGVRVESTVVKREGVLPR